MIIDAQHHIMPLKYAEFYSKHSVGPRCPQVTVNGKDSHIDFGPLEYDYPYSKFSSEASINMMDKFEIDITLLSGQIPDATLLPGELADEGTRIINDALQETIERYPGRYKGIGFLPWNLPDKAITEIQRLKKLGFVGVMLCSHISYERADLPVYEPIYEELARLGLPVFLHPMVPSWGNDISDYKMIPMMGFMIVESFCLMRLVLSGIVERIPDLRIVFPHCGGVVPYLAGRIWNQTLNMGRGMDNITIPPIEVLKSDQIWYDMVNPDPNSMKFLATFLGGIDRIMFSTDFPWVDQAMLFARFKEAFPDTNDQNTIFSGAAKKLLGI